MQTLFTSPEGAGVGVDDCVLEALNCDSWYEELKLKLTLEDAVDFNVCKNTLCS